MHPTAEKYFWNEAKIIAKWFVYYVKFSVLVIRVCAYLFTYTFFLPLLFSSILIRIWIRVLKSVCFFFSQLVFDVQRWENWALDDGGSSSINISTQRRRSVLISSSFDCFMLPQQHFIQLGIFLHFAWASSAYYDYYYNLLRNGHRKVNEIRFEFVCFSVQMDADGRSINFSPFDSQILTLIRYFFPQFYPISSFTAWFRTAWTLVADPFSKVISWVSFSIIN